MRTLLMSINAELIQITTISRSIHARMDEPGNRTNPAIGVYLVAFAQVLHMARPSC